MRYIDIRSDTVTQPTQKMRDAMYTAVVGDDVNRDDPTMLELEELAAKLVGKEAAMFVPSGTMGNQVSIMTHTRRGDEVICGELSHIVIHEVGAVRCDGASHQDCRLSPSGTAPACDPSR